MGHPSSHFNPIALAVTLALAAVPASWAGDILRGGSAAPQTNAPAATSGAVTAQAAKAQANAADSLARTSAALQAVQAMQNAARKVAIAGPNNLSSPGLKLPNVPNGLVLGGLVPITGLKSPGIANPTINWTGANAPTQTLASGKTKITIVQTQSQALLNWQTFNIGKNTRLTFDQTAGKADASKWIAFNQINDPTGRPTQILGSLDALGQVYVINQNGIIFGGSSQINTRTLAASALPINTNLVAQGILNNRDAQFLFSGLSVPGGPDGTPDFVPTPPVNGRFGDVNVQAGAQIGSLFSADGNGGRVFLVGANVKNEGTISTPAGQTILAAGLQVGTVAHSGSDPSLRGLDVWVGAVGDYAGTVTNNGLIDIPTGSVSFVGRSIHHNGIINSTTSVALNGRIDFKASYGAVANPNFDNQGGGGFNGPVFLNQFTGDITFGKNSLTQIVPDYLSTKTVPGTSLPIVSQINLEAETLYFAPQSLVLAPNGNISLRAGNWTYRDTNNDRTVFNDEGQIEPNLQNFYASGMQRLVYSTGRIYLDQTAEINVAGSTDVFTTLSQSILDVEFRGPELADSPLQREGALRGTALTLDIRITGQNNGRYWMGTSVGDATGLAGLIQRNAAQLTVNAGSITMQAGQSVVLQDHATLDVSGGFLRHEGGMVTTSRVLQNGHVIDIANAQAGEVYDGIYTGTFKETFAKYGIEQTYKNPLYLSGTHYENSYLEGAKAGRLSITAPSMALDGELLGTSLAGPRQRAENVASGSLTLEFSAERYDAELPAPFIVTTPTPPTITFSKDSQKSEVTAFSLTETTPTLQEDRLKNVYLSPDLFVKQGFGSLTITNNNGDFIVPENVSLELSPQGAITINAANVLIDGKIQSAGGSLNFTAYNISPEVIPFLPSSTTNPAPTPNVGRGFFSLGANATLDVSGLSVDDRITSETAFTQSLATNGGSILVKSYNADFLSGGVVDVSGGSVTSQKNTNTFGRGGSLSIKTGLDPSLKTVTGGRLSLEATLLGQSGSTGGTLELQASVIQIGGKKDPLANTLLLKPAFFQTGGFASFSLTGIGAAVPGDELIDGLESYIPGVTIAPDTKIEAYSTTTRLVSTVAGAPLKFAQVVNPIGQRAPVSLSFAALGADDEFTPNSLEIRGDIVMGLGASISTDPGASVSFDGQTVSILGTINAPAGKITLKGSNSFALTPTAASDAQFARPTLFLGENVILSAQGTAVYTPDLYGRRKGSLLSGGTISLSGNILALDGSLLDVSGSSAVFDLAATVLGDIVQPLVPTNSGVNAPLWKIETVATTINSDGGTINLTGGQLLASDATLRGNPGGTTAKGGTLSVFSSRFYSPTAIRTSADINLVVTQSGRLITEANNAPGVGVAFLDKTGAILSGRGYFTINDFSQGGFDSLDLGYKYLSTANPIPYGGNVEFQGPVTISAPGNLRVAGGGIIKADGAVHLEAGYIALGQPFQAPLNPSDIFYAFQQSPVPNDKTTPIYEFAPTYDTGNLTAQAELIDIGTLSLDGIGKATLVARNGDIRGNGIFNIAGDLTLQAAQIYPTTLATFGIYAFGYQMENSTQKGGTISILGSGSQPTPLSAGGTLNLFASEIKQGGNLKAPLGSINLGWNGTDLDLSDADLDRPINPITGTTLDVPVTTQVTLLNKSTTSVAALDENKALLIPYGLSPDGSSWIDPRGINITTGGVPEKRINLSGISITTQKGSTLDIRGGGDIYAYRWVAGNGGSRDILGNASSEWSSGAEYQSGDLVSFGGKTYSARVRHSGVAPVIGLYWSEIAESFAILPDDKSRFAAYSTSNTGLNAESLGGDAGYVSGSLQIGDQIDLEASSSLKAGRYTLLPRRYALLPGAFLVSPSGNEPIGTFHLPEGADYVSGYRSNSFSQAAEIPTLRSRYEIASSEVVRNRASYDDFLGNPFFTEAAQKLGIDVPQRLPGDAGYIAIQSTTGLEIHNQLLATFANNNRGAQVDVSSLADIFIGDGQGKVPSNATAVLSSELLSQWGAESLLIGGLRRTSAGTTIIDVQTSNLVLANPEGKLQAPEIILAAKNTLEVASRSSIVSQGVLTADTLPVTVVGDGVLLQVSADREGSVSRTGVTTATSALLKIGSNSEISGNAITLDSSYGTALDSTARISASNLTLYSGQISLLLETPISGLTGAIVPMHLVLQGQSLANASAVQNLTLGSYSTIDIYGSGRFGGTSLQSLTLQSSSLRGYAASTGEALLKAGTINLDNPANIANPAASTSNSGALKLEAIVIRLQSNSFSIAGYTNVDLVATQGVLGDTLNETLGRNSGTFTSTGNLTFETPIFTATKGSNINVISSGELIFNNFGSRGVATPGLGASISLTGSTILINTTIAAPSGLLSLRATTGNVRIGGNLDASGSKQIFYDLTRYASAGNISIIADAGNVELLAGSQVSVAAALGGGNSGTFSIVVPNGEFSAEGANLSGTAATGFTTGQFALDTRVLASYTDLSAALNKGGFFESRTFRLRTGDLTIANAGNVADTARNFFASTDAGNIRVLGTIDASGQTGGNISLVASGNLTLEAGAFLNAHGENFSSAGKGGNIRLEAGAPINGVANPAGVLDLLTNSRIDLGVNDYVAGDFTTVGSSAFTGKFTGTLQLRASRVGNDVSINQLKGEISGASSVIAEGYRIYDRTSANGILNASLRNAIDVDNTAFMVDEAILTDKLLAGTVNENNLRDILVISPGVEIINRTGNLTLGSAGNNNGTNPAEDWDLANYRYGSKGSPGVLTLRAFGNLVFQNALSDGFAGLTDAQGPQPSGRALWLANLMTADARLPLNTQSWSYRLIAGADFTAANASQVQALSAVAADSGSLQLGNFYTGTLGGSGENAQTFNAIAPGTGTTTRYQVIRTGTGSIEIAAARDVQLRNVLASIYTAGVGISNPTKIFQENDFSIPVVERGGASHPDQPALGSPQQIYPAQWSLAGGNIRITAGQDIRRVTRISGNIVTDTSRQIPTNWLYRRGSVESSSGLFSVGGTDSGLSTVTDPSASTAWWIDFSNFFQGVGTLGGGDLSLVAKQDVVNIDAVIPTNAHMAGLDSNGERIAPDEDKLVEYGGGDLHVETGNNIDGGIYYVERGQGTLFAANRITTNSSRSPSLGLISGAPVIRDINTWLPTTLFLGKGSFDISARGNVLLGPAASVYLLPQGVNNKFWYKTYFNTFGEDSAVNVASYGGSITHRLSVVNQGTTNARSVLQSWIENQNLYAGGGASTRAANTQPWIRIAETSVAPFATTLTIAAPTLRSTAFSSDINLVGSLRLFPSSQGTLELASAGNITGLNPAGRTNFGSPARSVLAYASTRINLSDADPDSIPGATSPLSYLSLYGRSSDVLNATRANFLGSLDLKFNETGSYTGSSATAAVKSALHATTPVHLNDVNPVKLYGLEGDITGITLFSAKSARVIASNDITDVAFYIQNVSNQAISLVSAGRDIIAYNENSTIRSFASNLSLGNIIADTLVNTVLTTSTGAVQQTRVLPGDIQISGPGVLEVLAGRNIDLGTGPNRADGTGIGITSIGNFRNPFLPFGGADLVVQSGVSGSDLNSPATSLSQSSLDFVRFIADYSAEIEAFDSPYLAKLEEEDFQSLNTEQQAVVALEVYNRLLRDTGRQFATSGNYTAGYSAISALYGTSPSLGDIFTRARDIRTSTGGAITLGAPGGGIVMASDIFGNPLTPPGIVTEYGGAISIFTDASVSIGQARIFTLRGGDITIWATTGDIAAGSAARTVVTAPPTRVVIDTNSADVQTDLGGLATGGGIGVLASVEGVPPGDVDLIAPIGSVDAGDAGIRVTGNINIAAAQVLNADNIQAAGTSTGVPTVVAPSVNLTGLTAASSAANATTTAANDVAKQNQNQTPQNDTPSIIIVEVLGYGG